MRFILAVFMLAGTVSSASGQIIRAPRGGEPPWIITATLGFLQAETIFDGSTGSAWDFGSALQYRVAVERRLGDQAALGVSVAQASVPLRYFLAGESTPSTTPCAGSSSSCDASSDMVTVAASFSAGGSYGLHQILNLGLGISFFDNFREDGSGQELAPLSGDKDFYMNLGYGLGYGISNRLAVALVQDASFIVHQRTGLSGNSSSFHRLLVTRLGLRLSLGR